MTNKEVCLAWSMGKSARHDNLTTNGKILWSYWLPIGFTSPTGGKFTINWTKNGYGFKSNTTSKHVSMAAMFGHIVTPSVATVDGGVNFVDHDVTVQTALFTLKLSALY